MGWDVLVLKTRVDAFNFLAVSRQFRKLRSEGATRIALDLRRNRFLSLPAIQFFGQQAQELQQSGGSLALLGASEKTKRHFEIYGSLEALWFVRHESELEPQTRHEMVVEEMPSIVEDPVTVESDTEPDPESAAET